SLEAAGYVERSFFGAENGGIVLVTRLERINEDGTSTKGSRRWPSEQIHPRMTAGGVTEFLSGLFYAEPGYYRGIVFVIGGTPFTQSQRRVPEVEALEWLSTGANRLPPELASIIYNPEEGCTALVYEFRSADISMLANTIIPGRFTGDQHLDKAGLVALVRRPN